MDKSRFEIEIVPLYKPIFGMCVTILRDRDGAADAVQETFVKLWERRKDLDGVSSVEAYAKTIAKHVCINRLRETSRNRELDCLEVKTTGDNSTEARSELGLVRQIMDTLPASQKRVLTLSSFGGCSNDEIAQITGESAANVRQLLSRARKKLKELYKKQTI